MASILIVDDLHPSFLNILDRENISCDYRPDFGKEETLACIENYEGLVIRSKFKVEEDFFKKASGLKFIARAGAGVDNIDEVAAAKYGVALLNASEGNRDAVAEHMMGMLLNLCHHLNRADREVRNGQWKREENRGYELAGKTIGIIGYGNNGSAMAKRLSGFGVRILAYDKYKKGFSNAHVQEVSLKDIFSEADILSMHVPLTLETKKWVNTEFIQSFRKPFVFLMGARGGIMDMEAVIQALKKGKITAAAFDVLPVEKFPDLYEADWFHYLKEQENVLFTPHVAGWTFESYEKISRVLAEKILYLKGVKEEKVF